MGKPEETHAIGVHGAPDLPAVVVDSYNAEIRDEDGFVGDRASRSAFQEALDEARKAFRELGPDPLGKESTERLSRKKLGKILAEGDPRAATVVQSAVEEFAQDLAGVIRRFLKLKAWQDTERIVIGGGLREHRVGELAILRTEMILTTGDVKIGLDPISHHPDEAGLIGAVHLVPPWILEGFEAILAVDIGGTNIRSGIVQHNLKKSADFSKAAVWKADIWRHADAKPSRGKTVDRLLSMLRSLVTAAEKEKIKLAPFVGIGCPGRICEDGSIEAGAQNLPGDWESSHFNLPKLIADGLPTIGAHRTHVLMHNDAVVQGLSEVPAMRNVRHWGVLTIGTGLGNARFTTRGAESR